MIPIPLISHCIAGIAGFGLAWWLQSVTIREIETSIREEGVKAVEAQQALTKETSDAWAKNLEYLRRKYRSGWVPALPGKVVGGVPAPSGSDAPVTDPAPPTAGPSEELKTCVQQRDELVKQAAETTLQLNTLQSAIEKQSGY